jgi:putative transposase
LDIDFVLQAQKQALARATAEIANSDQGSHFTSPRYTELFKKAGIKISKYRGVKSWKKKHVYA